VASLPDRVFVHRHAWHRRRGGFGPWVLGHAHRQHPPEHPRP
jgi:hypothetical protein